MQIAATSDIHWPRYQGLLKNALQQLPRRIDLFLVAGDLIYRGNFHGMRPLLEEFMEAKLQAPIIACFGNDDYDSTKETLRDIAHGQITFLDDEITFINIKKKRVGIVGSRGVLDRPTFWQARNLQGIREEYTKRIRKLDQLLAKAKAEADYTVLLTHYSPTYLTLQGETQRLFAQMGSKRIEKLLIKHSPTLVIHGHAHHGKKQVTLDSVQIYNVALPLNRRIVKIKLP